MRRACIILLTLLCPATNLPSAAAQSPPRLSLRGPTATTTEQFSEVTGLAELAPGRILVGDARERRLVVIDLATGRAEEISRIGSGPREFRSIGEHLIPRPTGGAWVVDFAQRRLLPVNPDGSLEDAIVFPVASMLVSTGDGAGRIYGETMIFSPERQLSDSVRLLRWTLAESRVDTLLTFHAGRAGMVVRPGGTFRVFRETTAWTILPTGAWVGLHAGHYRLTEWLDGRETRTSTLPFDRLPMSSADQRAWRAQQDAQPVRALGQPGATGGPRPETQYAFPEFYPAFDPMARLMLAPDGHLWIERLLGVGQAPREYDVIHPAGRLVARVVLPAGGTVAGFGRGVVYLAMRDADDLLTIRRHPLPALPAGR